MRRHRHAKIVATLGPASSSEEKIAALFEAGVDVFRLNFSHGTHADHRQRFEIIRGLERRFGRPIGILLDLQGPKLRLGDFEHGRVRLEAGQDFRLDLAGGLGNEKRAPLPHPEIFRALAPGTAILLDDGRVRLEVESCDEEYADTRVITAGELSNHKGVNVPTQILDLSPLTDKDHEDLRYGLELGADFIGLSFVQTGEDVAMARKLIAGRAAIMTKLEKPAAIEHLEEIVSLSDSVMVARGDLGVELPPEEVPTLQRRIIHSCRRAGKPVVVATQMLESMVHAPIPTRAEASDVATAVYEGADAVMLSAESAVGSYPVEAVQMMNRIIHRVEQDPLFRETMTKDSSKPEATAADAITAAARQCSATINAVAIVTFTSTGSTTLRASRERPEVPILGLTPRTDTARRLALAWGVHPVHTDDVKAFREMVTKSIKVARQEGYAEPGDPIIITAGVPFGTPGATNILRIAWVE